jgi:alpha-tubulin suppressor-like RCC1 family protein
MRFRSAVPGLAFLRWCGWFPFFFHKSKRALAFCLMAGLLPALFVPSAVAQSSTNTPIFQFAIFYNMDLEIDPGSAMTILGAVWSNGGIWTGSTLLTLANTVSAVGIATNTANDPFCTGYTGTGKSTYTVAGQPTSGNAPLTMAMIGTNNDPAAAEALINLPPANYAMGTAAAFTTNGQVYLANAADLYLTNFPNGTNWGGLTPRGTNMILYYQDANTTGAPPYQTRIPYDFYLMTNRASHTIFSTNYVSPILSTNIVYAGYSFVTNALFYDWREGWNNGNGVLSGPKGKAVQAVQINIAKFNIWLTNTAANNGGSAYNNECQQPSHKSHPIDSIYVYNAVPLTATTLPAVRVVNGGMLPSQTAPYGFTVVTPMPMYVWGNYNVSNNLGSSLGQNSTTYTWPAALMADSITIFSTSWNDSITSKMPTASTITVNAACLAGIVRSTNSLYSGGVENYLRTLESWSGVSLWYNGSIVAMFPSRYATNYWQPAGNYYAVPARQWAFDTNFLNLAKLPPLTPMVWNYTNPPVITTQPQSQTIPSGNNTTFGVAANGSGSLSYQWSFNGTNLAGATTASLTLTNVQFNQAGNYAVLVTNAFGSVLSSNAVLTVTAIRPTIQAQPTNQTVFVNGTATFSVTATGSLPLSYQWSFNGTDIDGATNASFTLANVQTNQAGNYAAQVTNLFGSTNSATAVLLVGLQPTIIIQPTNQTLTAGDTAVFSVTAGGSMPLSYQWRFNGTNLIGATNTSLILTNAQFEQSGNYAVQVANAFGSITSSNAVLDVIPLSPVILTQPASQTVCIGGTVVFGVSATGFSPLSYQWQFNGTNLVGQTNLLLTLNDVRTVNGGSYQVVVTNVNGSVTSSIATLTVVHSLVVAWGYDGYGGTDVPAGLTNVVAIAGGGGHSLALLNNGHVVAWGLNASGQCKVPSGLSNVVAIAGGGQHSLALQANGTVVAWGDNYFGEANVPTGLTNIVAIAGGSDFSAALQANGTVVAWGNNYLGVTNVPAGLTNIVAIAAGENYILTLQANGAMVAWGRVGVPAGLTNVVAIAGGGYQSMAIQANGTVLAWGLNFYGQINVPTGLTNAVAIAGGDQHCLALQANGTVLAWGRNDSGQTDVPADLTNVVAIAGGGEHSLALENDGSPVILGQPTSQMTFKDTTVLFNATVLGRSPLSYQWQLNGTNLDDASYATLTLTNVQLNQAGNYAVLVNNAYGSILSSNAVLTVLAPPSITTQPASCINIAGTVATFNAMADGTAPLDYQWQFNGTNLDGATNATLTLNSVTMNQAGEYSVTVTNTTGSVTSSNAILSVYATAAATLDGYSFSGDNGFQFQVAGVPGFNYAVQDSTNLIDWVSLLTNTAPFIFVDANATNFPQQFYRTLYVP